MEAELKSELEKRHIDKLKIENFINVMSGIYKQNLNHRFSNSRSKRKQLDARNPNTKRLRTTMNTSTPKQAWTYRATEAIPDETSPIVNDNKNDTRNRTDLSGGMASNKLTPIKPLSESSENRNLAGGAKDLSGANKKSMSLPNLSWDTIDNCLFMIRI